MLSSDIQLKPLAFIMVKNKHQNESEKEKNYQLFRKKIINEFNSEWLILLWNLSHETDFTTWLQLVLQVVFEKTQVALFRPLPLNYDTTPFPAVPCSFSEGLAMKLMDFTPSDQGTNFLVRKHR